MYYNTYIYQGKLYFRIFENLENSFEQIKWYTEHILFIWERSLGNDSWIKLGVGMTQNTMPLDII